MNFVKLCDDAKKKFPQSLLVAACQPLKKTICRTNFNPAKTKLEEIKKHRTHVANMTAVALKAGEIALTENQFDDEIRAALDNIENNEEEEDEEEDEEVEEEPQTQL